MNHKSIVKRLALAEVCPPSCAIFDVCGPFYILVQRKQHVHRHPKTFEQQRTRPSSRAPYHQKRSLFATVMSTSQGVGYGAPRGGDSVSALSQVMRCCPRRPKAQLIFRGTVFVLITTTRDKAAALFSFHAATQRKSLQEIPARPSEDAARKPGEVLNN